MAYIMPMLRECRRLYMTTSTRDRIIPGEPWFIEQFAPQLKPFPANGIIAEAINGFRKIHWLLESAEFIQDLLAAGDQQQETDGENEVSLIHNDGLILCMVMKENAGIVVRDVHTVVAEHNRRIAGDT